MKTLRDDSFMAKMLGALARAVCRYPRWFFYPQAVLFLASILYTVGYLKFDASRDNLVGSGKKYHQNFKNFKKEFPQPEDLVVVVESEDAERNRQFVERLGARLDAETNLFRDVFYKGDLKMMGSKALLFVPEDDLAGLKKVLGDFRPFIDQFTKATNLVTFFDTVNTRFRTGKREQNAETESLIKALPALERIVNQATDCLRRPGVPPSPGVTALFNAGEKAQQQEYITFVLGKTYINLITALAVTEAQNNEAVERLGRLVVETKLEVPGLNAGITGGPVLDHDEMLQSQRDTTVASVVSLVLCAMIFIYGYQETGRPIKATICLLVGLAYTMGFATLAVGHLNILTITFMPMLIGLAIDFGVHLVTRYEEELRHGRTEPEALTKALVFTGQGVFTGALTTAVAFLAMGLTNFKGIQEMGIICGGGLMICLVPMMTLLPVLLLRGRQNVIDHQLGDKLDPRERIENVWLRRPRLVACITLALCAAAVPYGRHVVFDYNLLNMQSAGLPAVQFERLLIHSTPKSVLFGVVMATNLQEAAALESRLKDLPVVSEVESMSRFLNENQASKLELIREIKQALAPIHHAVPDTSPVNILELSRTMYSLYGYLGAAMDEIGDKKPDNRVLPDLGPLNWQAAHEVVPLPDDAVERGMLTNQLRSLRLAVDRFRKEMLQGSATVQAQHAKKLAAFQQALFNDIRETFDALRTQDARERLRAEDLPPALRHRFVGVTGKHLLMVYPQKDMDLWQRENQAKFVAALQAVDPNVTGTPVQLYYYTELLRRSYEQAALYALIAIAVMVFIHFRSVGSVILALLPVVIGTIWLVGLMGLLQVPFNPANIMTLPLVIGIGVTNGIHILNRFAEEQTPSILAKSTGKAVLVSGLTTIAGFGSLILAKHQGIESLGYVMATGVATCMLAALTFLPALLNLLIAKGLLKKQPSADNARSTLGREEPR